VSTPANQLNLAASRALLSATRKPAQPSPYAPVSAPAATSAPGSGAKGRKRGRTGGKQAFYDHNTDHPAPAAVAECPAGARPLATGQAQNPNPARYLVSVTSFRVRLLDEDNLCPKYHVDALRYAGLLPSDAPDCTHIVTRQVKVAHKADEKSVIEMSAP
jgi:hypothetical protein